MPEGGSGCERNAEKSWYRSIMQQCLVGEDGEEARILRRWDCRRPRVVRGRTNRQGSGMEGVATKGAETSMRATSRCQGQEKGVRGRRSEGERCVT